MTGAGRGIGFELAAQYADAQWRVLATCRQPVPPAELRELERRHPDTVRVFALDVGDDAQLDALGERLIDEDLDLVISNAGWAKKGPLLADVTYESWEHSLRVNAYATLKLAQVLLEQVARSRQKTIVAIGSQMGSIAENDEGGRYAYRASKAALNMIVKTLSVDLARRDIVVASLHPGWVQTRLGGPSAPLPVVESVRGLRRVIAGLTMADTGRFLTHEGRELRW